MKSTKAETAYAIVDFWHTVEFLTQSDFPRDTPENRKKICDKKDLKSHAKHITLFHPLPIASVEQLLAEDDADFQDHLLYGQIHICMGKIKRVELIKKLYSALKTEDNRPEEDKSEICLICPKGQIRKVIKFGWRASKSLEKKKRRKKISIFRILHIN